MMGLKFQRTQHYIEKGIFSLYFLGYKSLGQQKFFEGCIITSCPNPMKENKFLCDCPFCTRTGTDSSGFRS